MTYFMSHFATIMTCDDDFLAKFWIIIGWSWKFKLWMSIVAIFATWAKSSQIIYTKDSSAIDLSEIDDKTLRPKSWSHNLFHLGGLQLSLLIKPIQTDKCKHRQSA